MPYFMMTLNNIMRNSEAIFLGVNDGLQFRQMFFVFLLIFELKDRFCDPKIHNVEGVMSIQIVNIFIMAMVSTNE